MLEFILTEEFISLIKDDGLNPSQFEISLLQQLHQPTRSSNYDIWIDR